MSGAHPVCRLCGAELTHTFVDLGSTPLANSYLREQELECAEPFYPLHAYVCARCFLVQIPAVTTPEAIFSDYAYFSSFSDSWLEHCARYADAVVGRFGLGAAHTVVEVASNDGYLLQYFARRGIPVLGIEPAANVAAAAEAKGIPTRVAFFGRELAERLRAEGIEADLLAANNVLAHVPALNDFVAGIAVLLASSGVATLEFPHLANLIEKTQFDTIYHEHFSYLSLLAVERACGGHGLEVFDVEEIPTHGGSLRLYCAHTGAHPVGARVHHLRAREAALGLGELETYRRFGQRVQGIKFDLLSLLMDAKKRGRSIAGYGAPAKATTLLNFCGIRRDFLDYTVDRSPHKQGRYLPGTHIPIFPPERLAETRPDLILLLAWNLRDEVLRQTAFVRDWGARYIVPIPAVEVV